MDAEHHSEAYRPVDLSSWCSAGVEVFDPSGYDSGGTWLNPEKADPKVGQCVLRGLPFLIGGDTDEPDVPRYLDFRTGSDPVRVLIEATAFNVVFAHSLLTTGMWIGGEHPGRTVARYVFEFDDGSEEQVLIRERFEIGHFPQPWGHSPFLAVPDNYEEAEDRRQGHWDRIGHRLTEVATPMTRAYHLWAWRNPQPDRRITALRIEPLSPGFIVAGITLGLVDEDPLRPLPRLGVLVEGSNRDDLTLSVDRGIATHLHPTVTRHHTGGTPPGWGRTGSGSRYAFVAATPSASLTLAGGDGEIARLEWAKLQTGAVDIGEGSRIVVEPPGRNWVHVTVRDQHGAPVPCRVAFTSEMGIPYPPHGHHAPVQSGLRAWNLDVGGDVLLGDVSYAYIDGRCQGWLPRGRVSVEVAKGFEYTPVALDVDLEPGQRELDVTIERWVDMAAEGWHSGDTHVHFLSPDGALTEAAGEGLSVVNLLQAQWGHLFTNVEDFTGRTRVSEDGTTFVHVSQENRQHVLGHLNLLGLREPVMPMSSDGASEAEPGGALDTTTSRWADAAHEQGATVIVAHMPTPNGENAVLIATGRADGLEMIDFNHFEHLEYYRYLNGGYRLPVVAGTDKMEATIPVGEYRTYARVDGKLTLESWLAALRAGRTFATSGPMLWFTVDGEEPGSDLRRPVGSTVSVKARARSIFPVHVLQVVQGGDVVAETTSAAGARKLELEAEVTVTAHGWLAARTAGPGYGPGARHLDHDRRPVMAHTSPVYVETGERLPLQADTDRYLLSLVEGGLGYVRSAIHHPPGSVTYPHGLEDHNAYLEEPFLEAQAALAARIASWDRR
jgi:hypothetical protein